MEQRETSIRQGDGEPQEQENGSLQNVGDLERIASVAVGGLLGFLAFRQRNALGAGLGLLGLALAGRGVAGRCGIYRRAGIDTTSRLKLPRGYKLPALGAGGSRDVSVEQSITLNNSRRDLYERWRRLEDLPRYLRHIESVQVIEGGRRSHWVARGPLGVRAEWDAEIIDDRPDEWIAWRSLPGSDIENEGEVRFTDAPAGRGSELRVKLCYRPLGGSVLSPLLSKITNHELREDLRRFKQAVEAGEIPSTDGQPHGGEGARSEMKRVRPPEPDAAWESA
jgi:uncharacterized membrane protein